MNCPQCNSPVIPGSAFCDNCGADVSGAAAPQSPPVPTAGAATCPSCSDPIVPGEAFCDNCGAALDQVLVQPTHSVRPQQPATPAGASMVSCPQCQTQLPTGSAFCDNCGAKLDELAAPQPAYQPPPAVHSAPARLVVQNSNVTLSFPQGQTEILVGREDPVSNHFPEIDMTEHGGEQGGVSRKHARFLFQNGQWHLEDLNSVNGTWVNPLATRQKLQHGQPWPLNSGDEVRFGRVVTTFYL